MNSKEKIFLQSIKEKIKDFNIDTTINSLLDNYFAGHIAQVQYINGKIEDVDIGIERRLCSISPSYFITHYAWIDFPGIGVVPFELYFFQKKALERIQNYQKVVIEKSRQVGISTLFSLYCLWRGNFHDSENIDVVSLKQQKAQAFVTKMNPTINRMPEFLKTEVIRDNTTLIEWANGSKIVSESQSENAGRSDSLSLLILDEAAHYRSERMIRGIVAAAQPTLNRTGGSLMLISTPNSISGAGSYYYEQVMKARMGSDKSTFHIMIDWWQVPDFLEIPGPKKGYNHILKEYEDKNYFDNKEVLAEAKKYFSKAEENFKDNEWLKKQYDDLGEVLFKQEIFHNFIVSGSAVFSEDILDRFKDKIKEPIQKDKLGTYSIQGLWIWKHPVPGHRYSLGVDVSTGTGNDFASIQVFDIDEYEQAAEYKGMMSTKMLGRFIKIIAKYYNEGFIIIECNSIGEAVFNEVYYHDTDPYINVYRQKKVKNGVTRMTGWVTDVKTRKLITNEFIDWFVVDNLFNQIKVYSERLYLEMTTWIWDGQKPIHSESAHDDSIIAFSLVLYLRNEATKAGEGYLITDDGQLISYDSSKDNVNKKEEDNFFGIITDNDNNDEEDFFQKNYNVSKNDYAFLVGE
jgi:hypothetical protein